MAKVAVYTWSPATTTAIAQLQTTVGAATLLLNGTLLNPNQSNFINFPGNVSRTVSLTSTNNLSGVNVTVTGIYQGATQTQTIAGPNNNTVYTTKLFDTVTLVTVNGAVTAISVGSGIAGQTQWYLYDYYAPYAALTAQVNVIASGGGMSYTFQTTLDDVTTNASPFINSGVVMPNPGNADAYQTVMSAETTSQLANISYPIRYANVVINTGEIAGSFVLTLLQQGIK